MSGATLAGLGLTALPSRGAAADPETPVARVVVDSREAGEGDVFVAVPGTRMDGAEFAQYAVRKGALAVVATEAGADVLERDLGGLPVPVFLVADPRVWVPRLAARIWPRQPETVVAVTGTNGKTSVVHFLRQIWEAAGLAAVSLGTTGIEGAGQDGPLGHTTPDAIVLHRALDRLAGAGVTHAAMEASSHGLAQHRVDGVRLAAAGLTNITRDHMDYHATHEDYVAAKMGLFALLPDGAAAVVHEGPHAGRVAEIAVARGLRPVTVGTRADVAVRYAAEPTATGQTLTLALDGTAAPPVQLSLLGAFQAQNVAVAAALAHVTGTPAAAIMAALPALRGVPGRMQRVAVREGGAQIVVDYAHTPDALAAALVALRPHVAGRLVVVFGAGGDRDSGKRPLMGRAAAEHADHVIVTDDNPRSEDPAAIRAAVMRGCPEAEEIDGRAEAVLTGVDTLKCPGDCLLIAGKGHETGQEIGGVIHPFDDAEQARAAVAALDGDGDIWEEEG